MNNTDNLPVHTVEISRCKYGLGLMTYVGSHP